MKLQDINPKDITLLKEKRLGEYPRAVFVYAYLSSFLAIRLRSDGFL